MKLSTVTVKSPFRLFSSRRREGSVVSKILMMLFSVAVIFISGCATTRTIPTDPSVIEAREGFYLREVKVYVSDKFEVDQGTFDRADNLSDEEFFDLMTQQIDKALTQRLPSALRGEMPADVVVEVTRLDISSSIGRALVGSNSCLGGWVRIEDADSGSLIAEEYVVSDDFAMQGNLGVLFNMVSAIVEDETEVISEKFSEDVVSWLNRGYGLRHQGRFVKCIPPTYINPH